MTAEIAILNRTALAFAADSAATLTGPAGSKTFDSAEKIFELCLSQPIGLMIFNNAQFMGVPLDVVARRFRAQPRDPYGRLVDVWPDFKEFLAGFPRDVEDERQHISQHALRIIKRVQDAAFNLRMQTMQGSALSKKKVDFTAALDPTSFVIDVADRFRAEFENDPIEGYLAEATLEAFEELYGERIDFVIRSLFKFDPDNEVKAALRQLMFAVIKSKNRSGGMTGLVFGGFGEEDIFPSLRSVEIDGVYMGQLRVLADDTIDIDRRGETAAVVPFAQKDMPQRFIYGLDDGLQRQIEQMVGGVVDEIVAAKPRVYKDGTGAAIRAAAQRRVTDALEQFKAKSEQKLKSVVNFMSKRELAEVAHSLVELTSRKRRFSDDQDTVGGPIDVAVLSKSDGFIWIQRKHYFEPELNPSYFVRNKDERRAS